FGDRDRAVLLLISLRHGDQRAADRDARAVERVHVANLAVLAAIARVHAARLELAADRAARDFPIGPLPRQPDLDVVGLLRGKAGAGGPHHLPGVMRVEPAQDFSRARKLALVLVAALLRRRDRDELAFVDLVLADHAARILAGSARL